MSGMLHGTYLDGDSLRPHLRGKSALLRPFRDDLGRAIHEKVLAQFDDMSLAQAYGWHMFPTASFDIIIPSD